jgi:hypothetical protein
VKEILFLLLSWFSTFIYAQNAQEFTDLKGDYLGQKPPGLVAEVFARGIISTDDLEHSPAFFSPNGNEVFWRVNRPPGPDNEEWTSWGMTMRRIGDNWTVPEVSPFGGMFIFSPDGRQGYFWSHKERDIFVVAKQGDNWGKPKSLNFIARYPELEFAPLPSITRDGTLYFLGIAKGLGLQNDYGLYRTKLINGEYAKPKLLPRCINLPPYLNWTPFIAPDESYLIFSSHRYGELGSGDLYISFHDISSDTWSEPVNMGEQVNSRTQERLPGVSPDGKYLFFTRDNPPHSGDVFWVSAEIIDRLREGNKEKK